MTPEAFVRAVAAARFGAAFNFYARGPGAAERRRRLVGYLGSRAGARLLLVGEAAGFRGARVSGVPFTSERQLTGSRPAEASATIVHRVLSELGITEDVLLWNVVPAHPHVPGRPGTNRSPRRAEIAAGLPFVEELARGRHVVAVGRVAGTALGLPPLRHPSHGGAAPFAAGLRSRADSLLLHSRVGGRMVRPFSVDA